MSPQPLAILKTGLLTAVGGDAPSSCAALRAKVSNPTPTRFMDSTGEWILAHQVALETPERDLAKLARMAALVVEEAMADVPKAEWPQVPLLLCLAEKHRPGRLEGLDERLLENVQRLVGQRFAAQSTIVQQGRVGVAVALGRARLLVQSGAAAQVLIVAVDSLLTWSTLAHYDRADRLLREDHSNGFMPGEGAGALRVGAPDGEPALLCTGIGLALEPAPIDSEQPLRAEGLSQAIRAAVAESACAMSDVDYRITDVSGEQYYFREASLALSRTLHQPKAEFDHWHPAECIGEAGALAGAAIVALADAACRKAYGHGPNIVAHMSADPGQRAALMLQFRSP